MTNDLTICSVSFHNRAHLELNYRLAERLNGRAGRHRWLIAENTPHGPRRLRQEDGRFEVHKGAENDHVPNHQHTLALNSLIPLVGTRFLLVIDPDFYLVLPSWHNAILEHMKLNELSFFGVPWHPRHGEKYRYFPCVHCLFVDLERVAREELDFRPTWPDSPGVDIEWPYQESDFRPSFQRFWFSLLDTCGMRRRRANYCDSGSRLYRKFSHHPQHKYEAVQPVVRLGERTPRSLKSRLFEFLLPEEYCYRPKRKGYFADRGLRERGLLCDAPPNWEEFMWGERPFGFHVRRNFRKEDRSEMQEVALLTQLVDSW